MRGKHVKGIILTATMEKNAISPGESVNVELSMHNDGTISQQYGNSSSFEDYSVFVNDDTGQNLPQKTLPEYKLMSSFHTIINLQPNNTVDTFYPLSLTYDLRKEGTYYITAQRNIYDPDYKHTSNVVSNTVILYVTSLLTHDYSLQSSISEYSTAKTKTIVDDLTLRNTSKEEKKLALSGQNDGYIFTVQDFRGDIIHPIKNVRTGEKNTIERILKPNKSMNSNIPIEKIFDIRKEGRYFFTAMHYVPDGDGQNKMVYSNTVILYVKSKASKQY